MFVDVAGKVLLHFPILFSVSHLIYNDNGGVLGY